MSSKFNPSTATRKPPPQCKKSKPAPTVVKLTGNNPLIAGTPLFISWRWTWTIGLVTRAFKAVGYAQQLATDLWSLTDEQSPIDTASVGLRFFFASNEFIIVGEAKIGGIDAALVTDTRHRWPGQRPFHFPQSQIEFTTPTPATKKFLTFGITA